MAGTRVALRTSSLAVVLGAFVASLSLAGCGEGSMSPPPAEELAKRAKYQDLHPELFKPAQKGKAARGSRRGVR
jgi:hypothetical protein